MLSVIINDAQKAEFFALTIDEATDLSPREQVAIFILYCTPDLSASERLISLTDADKVINEQHRGVQAIVKRAEPNIH